MTNWVRGMTGVNIAPSPYGRGSKIKFVTFPRPQYSFGGRGWLSEAKPGEGKGEGASILLCHPELVSGSLLE